MSTFSSFPPLWGREVPTYEFMDIENPSTDNAGQVGSLSVARVGCIHGVTSLRCAGDQGQRYRLRTTAPPDDSPLRTRASSTRSCLSGEPSCRQTTGITAVPNADVVKSSAAYAASPASTIIRIDDGFRSWLDTRHQTELRLLYERGYCDGGDCGFRLTITSVYCTIFPSVRRAGVGP